MAQESGLSAGTVQYHYRTRKYLLVAALERSVERQTQRVMAALQKASPKASFSAFKMHERHVYGCVVVLQMHWPRPASLPTCILFRLAQRQHV